MIPMIEVRTGRCSSPHPAPFIDLLICGRLFLSVIATGIDSHKKFYLFSVYVQHFKEVSGQYGYVGAGIEILSIVMRIRWYSRSSGFGGTLQ